MSKNFVIPLSQSADPWRHDVLGHGDAGDTISLFGCLLTAFTIACNAHGVTKHATPRTMNNFLKKVPGAFVDKSALRPGVLLNLPVAAEAVGLHAFERERIRSKIGDHAISAKVIDTLDKGGLCIIHVDTDVELTHDGRGNHFILAHRRVGPTPNAPAHIECVDPAPGRFMWLAEDTMDGPSTWGVNKTKHFRAVGAAPIFLPT